MTGSRAKLVAVVVALLVAGLGAVSCSKGPSSQGPGTSDSAPQAAPPSTASDRSGATEVPKPESPVPPPNPQNTQAAVQPVQPARHMHRREAPKPGAGPSKGFAVQGKGGGGGSPAAPREDPAAALDNALTHLKTGNLVYSTPERMKMAETAHIVARIASGEVSVETLKAGMPNDAGTQVATEATSITPKMKMTLTSADFDITALSSAEQMVAGSSPTTWEWDIVPKHAGELRLHLAAVIELGGLSKDYTTVDREVAVKVDPVDAVGAFVKGNWQWIIATLTAIVGAVWRFFSARKKTAGSTGE